MDADFRERGDTSQSLAHDLTTEAADAVRQQPEGRLVAEKGLQESPFAKVCIHGETRERRIDETTQRHRLARCVADVVDAFALTAFQDRRYRVYGKVGRNEVEGRIPVAGYQRYQPVEEQLQCIVKGVVLVHLAARGFSDYRSDAQHHPR